MEFSNFLISGGLLLLTGAARGRTGAPKKRVARKLVARLARWKPVDEALKLAATARFARSLSMGYRSGISIADALMLAAMSSPARGGRPRRRVHVVQAGEEAGKLDHLRSWVGTLYEREFQHSLERFVAVVEPTLMLGMGVFIGLILIAPLLPMVNVLQTL